MTDADREISKGIVVNPRRCGGTPTIQGTRISAYIVADMQAGDDPMSAYEILEWYPSLSYADVVNAKWWNRRAERNA